MRSYNIILQKTNDLINKTKNIKEQYYQKNEEAFDFFYQHELIDIISNLHLRSDSKETLLKYITELKIYNQYYVRKVPFVIKYKYNSNNYKFVTESNGMTTIYKNKLWYKTYNLINEFRTFNYAIMDQCYCLENYITLFVEDIEIRLGMHLLAYYYPSKYKNTIADLESFFKKQNVKQLLSYFSNTEL